MLRTLYHFSLLSYRWLLGLASYWHPKARQWRQGRHNWAKRLQPAIPKDQAVLWMHCASVGEFEQGRPVLERVRADHPHFFIVLSFYSPSGYEVKRNTSLADYVAYLPLDTPKQAQTWVNLLSPRLSIFVKYEFWYHYLQALRRQNCPTILIAGVFRPNQWFFQWYGRWALSMLQAFQFFFLQDQASAQVLDRQGIQQYQVVGDPRVDRVLQIAANGPSFPLVESFTNNCYTLVIGSSWPKDQRRYLAAVKVLLQWGWKIIIAPHEVAPTQLSQLETQLGISSVRYSQLPSPTPNVSVLIIDNIGMLAALYRYADLAYVGGGFGKSIHNILEPVAHGVPVIFGPQHHKFMEASGLIDAGGGFVINDESSCVQVILSLLNDSVRKKAGKAARNYLEQQTGATDKILDHTLVKGILAGHRSSQ